MKYFIFTIALFMTIRTIETLVMSPSIARLAEQGERVMVAPLSIVWLLIECVLWSYFI